MTEVAFSNIQTRNDRGSLIGSAADVTLTFPDSMPLAQWGNELASHVGAPSVSFSYEIVKALTDTAMERDLAAGKWEPED